MGKCKLACDNINCNLHDIDHYNKFIILLTPYESNYIYQKYLYNYIIKRMIVIIKIKKIIKDIKMPKDLLLIIDGYMDSFKIEKIDDKYYIYNHISNKKYIVHNKNVLNISYKL